MTPNLAQGSFELERDRMAEVMPRRLHGRRLLAKKFVN
jgi:hypothetical protein